VKARQWHVGNGLDYELIVNPGNAGKYLSFAFQQLSYVSKPFIIAHVLKYTCNYLSQLQTLFADQCNAL